MEKVDWFAIFVNRLLYQEDSDLYSDGDCLFCETEDMAAAIATLLNALYESQGDDLVFGFKCYGGDDYDDGFDVEPEEEPYWVVDQIDYL